MRGVPDEQIGLEVDCRPVAERIVVGLGEHHSQQHVISDDPTNTEQWTRRVGRTWGVLAWPPRPATDGRLSDLFEGLPIPD
jgi:hypothetical protein